MLLLLKIFLVQIFNQINAFRQVYIKSSVKPRLIGGEDLDQRMEYPLLCHVFINVFPLL